MPRLTRYLLIFMTASLIGCGSEDSKFRYSLSVDNSDAAYFAYELPNGNWQQVTNDSITIAQKEIFFTYICSEGPWHNIFTRRIVLENNQTFSTSTDCYTPLPLRIDEALVKLNIMNNSDFKLTRVFHSNGTTYDPSYIEETGLSEIYLPKTSDSVPLLFLGEHQSRQEAYMTKLVATPDSEKTVSIDFLNDSMSYKLDLFPIPEVEDSSFYELYELTFSSDSFVFSPDTQVLNELYFTVPEAFVADSNSNIYIERWRRWSDYNSFYEQRVSTPAGLLELENEGFEISKSSLSVNPSTLVATFEHPEYEMPGATSESSSLKYTHPMNQAGYFTVWFEPEEDEERTIFRLIDFHQLPGFPTDKIPQFQYVNGSDPEKYLIASRYYLQEENDELKNMLRVSTQ